MELCAGLVMVKVLVEALSALLKVELRWRAALSRMCGSYVQNQEIMLVGELFKVKAFFVLRVAVPELTFCV